MCIFVGMCMCRRRCLWGLEERTRSLTLELQVFVSHSAWVPGPRLAPLPQQFITAKPSFRFWYFYKIIVRILPWSIYTLNSLVFFWTYHMKYCKISTNAHIVNFFIIHPHVVYYDCYKILAVDIWCWLGICLTHWRPRKVHDVSQRPKGQRIWGLTSTPSRQLEN